MAPGYHAAGATVERAGDQLLDMARLQRQAANLVARLAVGAGEVVGSSIFVLRSMLCGMRGAAGASPICHWWDRTRS
jgi:hypothetical protein